MLSSASPSEAATSPATTEPIREAWVEDKGHVIVLDECIVASKNELSMKGMLSIWKQTCLNYSYMQPSLLPSFHKEITELT